EPRQDHRAQQLVGRPGELTKEPDRRPGEDGAPEHGLTPAPRAAAAGQDRNWRDRRKKERDVADNQPSGRLIGEGPRQRPRNPGKSETRGGPSSSRSRGVGGPGGPGRSESQSDRTRPTHLTHPAYPTHPTRVRFPARRSGRAAAGR